VTKYGCSRSLRRRVSVKNRSDRNFLGLAVAVLVHAETNNVSENRKWTLHRALKSDAWVVGEYIGRQLDFARRHASPGDPPIPDTLPPGAHFEDHYGQQIACWLQVSLFKAPDWDRLVRRLVRTKIEVVNKGSEIVSLLCLRIVVFGSNGEILSESNEWAATPIAADHDCRGPLMPGSHRYFVSSSRALGVFLGDQLRTEVEVTDLRVWNRPDDRPLIEDRVLSEAQVTEPSEELESTEVY